MKRLLFTLVIALAFVGSSSAEEMIPYKIEQLESIGSEFLSVPWFEYDSYDNIVVWNNLKDNKWSIYFRDLSRGGVVELDSVSNYNGVRIDLGVNQITLSNPQIEGKTILYKRWYYVNNSVEILKYDLSSGDSTILPLDNVANENFIFVGDLILFHDRYPSYRAFNVKTNENFGIKITSLTNNAIFYNQTFILAKQPCTICSIFSEKCFDIKMGCLGIDKDLILLGNNTLYNYSSDSIYDSIMSQKDWSGCDNKIFSENKIWGFFSAICFYDVKSKSFFKLKLNDTGTPYWYGVANGNSLFAPYSGRENYNEREIRNYQIKYEYPSVLCQSHSNQYEVEKGISMKVVCDLLGAQTCLCNLTLIQNSTKNYLDSVTFSLFQYNQNSSVYKLSHAAENISQNYLSDREQARLAVIAAENKQRQDAIRAENEKALIEEQARLAAIADENEKKRKESDKLWGPVAGALAFLATLVIIIYCLHGRHRKRNYVLSELHKIFGRIEGSKNENVIEQIKLSKEKFSKGMLEESLRDAERAKKIHEYHEKIKNIVSANPKIKNKNTADSVQTSKEKSDFMDEVEKQKKRNLLRR